ncbi:MAG: DUF1732 domain-containing protein [Thermotogae bacterium]|nr:DUF1732 domain-containing protein [Thermotogota bacterium]
MLSMTGYTKLKKVRDSLGVEVELRSLNSKGLNLSVSVQPELHRLAFEVHRFLSRRLLRGSVNCKVRLIFLGPSSLVKPDMSFAGAVISGLRNVSEEFGIPDTTTTDTLSRFKEIFVVEIEEEEWNALWCTVEEVLKEAVEMLNEERGKEGERLRIHILSLLSELEGLVENIDNLAQKQREEVKGRLEKSVKELLRDSKVQPDEGILETEIATAASKCDIEEEIVRLRFHIERARELATLEEPVGTRLDFLCQEMLRELNTIASKTVLNDISHTVVESKWTVSQLREQVQNVL